MKHVVAWAAWWLALFWLWFLLVGEWNRQELVAAAIAATIAATLAELARTRTGFHARVPLRGLTDLPPALGMVVVDFGIVSWALLASVARRRVVRGRLVSRPVEGGAVGVRGVGPRAWTVLVASYSPNAYPIDVDPETGTVLLHDLVPHGPSERPL
ncbi:MAG TPA: hypothetical protein VJ838_11640 [Gaiellaceae bacterium]|nr:hypothetical protein [Gaiellaceae bacterium]